MTRIPLFLLILVPAIAFGGWPALVKGTKVSYDQAAITIFAVGAICMMARAGPGAFKDPPTAAQAFVILFAGVLNYAGMELFGQLTSRFPEYVSVTQSMMPVVGMLGFAALVTWRAPTPGQMFGMLLVVLGIITMGYFTPVVPAAPIQGS